MSRRLARPAVEVGQVWEDRDARMNGRKGRVVSLDDRGKVRLACQGSFTRVRVTNLWTRWKLVPASRTPTGGAQ